VMEALPIAFVWGVWRGLSAALLNIRIAER